MALDFSGLSRLTKEYGTGSLKREESYELDINLIHPDPDQPRKEFDEEALHALAASIRELGLIQPIAVRSDSELNGYRIISGERRYRAIKLLGLSRIRAVVIEQVKEENIGYLQMAENLQRRDLTVNEIVSFILERLDRGETQSLIADKLGIGKARVSQYAAWQKMPDFLKSAVRNEKINSIQTAYSLFKTWEIYPEEVEIFVEEQEKITQKTASDFAATVGKTKQVKVAEQTAEVEFPRTDSEKIEPDFNVQTSENEETNAKENETDLSDFSINNDGPEGSETKTEIYRPTAVEVDKPNQKKPADLTEPKTQTELYCDPRILGFHKERKCELLYMKKTDDGKVWVRYEDDSEDEVPAEEIRLSRIVEK